MTKYTLPDLPYAYDALEPIISKEIMELHHKKHHQTYVNKLNEALEKYAEAEKKEDLAAMIALQPAIRFNGGGHINHSLFWENLAPKGTGGQPEGKLLEMIEKRWSSLEAFQEKFNETAAAIAGSGWCWLGVCCSTKQLVIRTAANQDPLMQGVYPLLGIDLWEHAYYLQYENVRPNYLKAIWEVVNWKEVNNRLKKLMVSCPACA